jgi:hypothetical protein
VWDDTGRCLFRSDAYTSPLTAAAWRPAGDTFAVGLHNCVLLCDGVGWAASAQAHSAGGAHALVWAPDSTACAAACGRGRVLVGGVLGLARAAGSLQARCHFALVQGVALLDH